jgi:hypothetical protein
MKLASNDIRIRGIGNALALIACHHLADGSGAHMLPDGRTGSPCNFAAVKRASHRVLQLLRPQQVHAFGYKTHTLTRIPPTVAANRWGTNFDRVW